jgi:hypothetical protein
MNSRFYLLMIITIFMGIIEVYGEESDAIAVPQAVEKAKTYGDKGTLELGLSGMAGVSSSSGTVVQGSSSNTFPTKTYSGNASIFVKYYIADHIHAGGSIVGNFALSYDDQSVLQNGNGLVSLFGEVGYAFPISRGLQLDLTGGLGFAADYITWNPIWCFIFNLKPMLLFPIGENANIGIGGMLTGMNIDTYINDEYMTDTTIKMFSLTTNALVQISIYF